jgi:putative addiction module component (TIGR02574 family)
MSTAADEILRGALTLSDADRAEVAARLLESLDESADTSPAEIEAAWAAEIERRCAALDSGETTTTAWAEVQQKIEAEILPR